MSYSYTPHIYWNYYLMHRAAQPRSQKKEKEKVPVEIKVENNQAEEIPQEAIENKVVMDTESQTIALPSGEIYKYMSKCIEENPVLLSKQLSGNAFTQDELSQLAQCAQGEKQQRDNIVKIIAIVLSGIFVAYCIWALIMMVRG